MAPSDPAPRNESRGHIPSHLKSGDKQGFKNLKTQSLSITKNTMLFHALETVFLSVSKK